MNVNYKLWMTVMCLRFTGVDSGCGYASVLARAMYFLAQL